MENSNFLVVEDSPTMRQLISFSLKRFKNAVKASKAKFKIIMNETPIQQFYALPYDRWEGYAAERLDLINFLMTNVPNAVFLTTDTHANFVNDVRFQTLEPGGPVDSGITEVITGPVAAMTFAKEIDSVTRSPGSGVLISGLFFKPAPLRGVGMRCVAPDVFSYAEVSVTSSTLTVTSKDAGGHVVTDVTGQPCPPVVLHAQSG